MLKQLMALFEQPEPGQDEALEEDSMRLSCAALLVEVATIDQHFDERERSALYAILSEHYGITEDERAELTAEAKQASADATSMYQFTALVDRRLSYQDKCLLVVNMWRMAYADGELDKYEEYIIRKTADLLHLSHSDFMRAKHQARSDQFPEA
jgi:uncharacterized tellurite resistance protein B-like protein